MQRYNAALLHDSFVATNDQNLESFQTAVNSLCFCITLSILLLTSSSHRRQGQVLSCLAVRTTENSLDLSPILFTQLTRQDLSCLVGGVDWASLLGFRLRVCWLLSVLYEFALSFIH